MTQDANPAICFFKFIFYVSLIRSQVFFQGKFDFSSMQRQDILTSCDPHSYPTASLMEISALFDSGAAGRACIATFSVR
jgi:hypothetical protein